MNEKVVEECFIQRVKRDTDTSDVVFALETLIKVVQESKASTIQELVGNIKECMVVLKKRAAEHGTVTSVRSGCEQFLQIITRGAEGLECETIENTQRVLVERGNKLVSEMVNYRSKIATLFVPFISEGSKILTLSRSRVTLATLQAAAKRDIYFHVYVTESTCSPQGLTGEAMCKELTLASISNTLVADAAVGYVMEQIDMVMVGAECVVESGGFLNRIGTYTMAMCAKQLGKPLYVLAESFKFVRLYPLSQQDLPENFKYPASLDNEGSSRAHPKVDYTPPHYITLLFTDLGILTPSAVSDELIKLYL